MMKSISAEGNGVLMLYNRKAWIVLFALLITAALANSFYITPMTISDSDFTTYIGVAVIMLPLLAFFMLKEDIIPKVGRKDIVAGVLFFAVLIAITVVLRESLSYLFLDMRLDMLFFPLLILSLVSLLFGFSNINRFKWIIVYSIFASPIVLLWLSAANSGFVYANALVIFEASRFYFHGATFLAPMTIIANGYRVGIGETCIGIGVLIGIIMFLAPLAYLFDGNRLDKAKWVMSGFFLVLLLNLARMLSISIAWLLWGPNSAVLIIHEFAGELLFYISIAAMVLLAGTFGLKFPKGAVKSIKHRRSVDILGKAGIAVAVLFVALYFVFTYGYDSVGLISSASLHNTAPFNASMAYGIAESISNHTGFHTEISTDTQVNRIEMQMVNATFNQTYPIEILIMGYNASETEGLVSKNAFIGERNFVDNLSRINSVYYLGSNGQGYLVYNSRIPYEYQNQSYTDVGIYAVMPAALVSGGTINCISGYDAAFSQILNAMNPHAYNESANLKIDNAYCMLHNLVST